MAKSWAEEQLEEHAATFRKLNEKEKEFGTHSVRVRKIKKVLERIETFGKILKNQEGWSKHKVRKTIARLTN